MDRKKLVMLNDAIYYPFINLPNDSWFRTSILFWDTINPIVPREIYYAMDSRSLLKVLEANNAARPIYPEEISLGSKANVFTESVLGYAEGFLKQVDPSERTGSYSKIHRVKMPWELQKELEQMTFLQVIPDDYDWFYLYTPLANIFMGELARFLANDKGMIPLTDQNESGEYIFGLPEKQIQSKSIFETMSSWFKQSEEEGERDEYSVRQIALRFLFQKILPTPSAGFDIEALLKIKEDNRELLYNFRNSFRAVVDRINQEQSKSEVLETNKAFNYSWFDHCWVRCIPSVFCGRYFVCWF